jgi:hypothetical protein
MSRFIHEKDFLNTQMGVRALPVRLRYMLLALLLIVASVWFMGWLTRKQDEKTGLPLVLPPQEQPFMTKPKNPGGASIPYQDASVYDIHDGHKATVDIKIDASPVLPERGQVIAQKSDNDTQFGFKVIDLDSHMPFPQDHEVAVNRTSLAPKSEKFLPEVISDKQNLVVLPIAPAPKPATKLIEPKPQTEKPVATILPPVVKKSQIIEPKMVSVAKVNQKAPSPLPAMVIKAAKPLGFVLQFGAYRTESLAKIALKKINLTKQQGLTIVPGVDGEDKRLFRIISRIYQSKKETQRICTRLKRKGVECFVRRPLS